MMNNHSSIRGLGTDIIEIDRIQDGINDHGQNFLDKLFSKKEQQHCLKYKDSAARFAARFAAKEAVAKALGSGFGKDFAFLDAEILNEGSGKPYIVLSKRAQEKFKYPNLLLSMSHCKSYAVATVLWEK